MMFASHRTSTFFSLGLFALALATGCNQKPPVAPPTPPPTPVQTAVVSNSDVPVTDTYVATIKSRRSATMQPQVDGNLTKIFVKSGDSVRAGQVLMQIDPLKQVAAVQAQQGAEQQQRASLQYNQADASRQKALFDAGIISRQAYEISLQGLKSSQGAVAFAAAQTNTQKQQLAYYQIRAPFAGIVGDIPVHLGDYVSPQTQLTTVDENSGLEAYIYIPAERAASLHTGLAVDLTDSSGAVLGQSTLSFLSPQVDNGLQSVLAKAPVPPGSKIRNGQLVKARVTFRTNQQPTVPVLAVTRIGGQSFLFVAAPRGNGFAAHQVTVQLGETIGNNYPVVSGLNLGDRVILSGIQFLQEGAPVQPLPSQPGPPRP